MIPIHFHTQSRVFNEIYNLAKTQHNDMALGKAIRTIMQDYKDGKYNNPSSIELDNPIPIVVESFYTNKNL